MSNEMRENFMAGLKFEGNGRKALNGAKPDVSLAISGRSGKSNRISLTFRNDVHEFFNSGRIRVAIFKNRVVIIDSEAGLTLTTNGTSEHVRYSAFVPSKEDEWTDFIGDYDLEYDDLYEYYFIDKNSKK